MDCLGIEKSVIIRFCHRFDEHVRRVQLLYDLHLMKRVSPIHH